jgi:hypothetical protein
MVTLVIARGAGRPDAIDHAALPAQEHAGDHLFGDPDIGRSADVVKPADSV